MIEAWSRKNAAIERLVRRQLKLIGEVEARRKDYLANPPPAAAGPERMPLMLAGEVALLAAALLILRRVLRKRR